MLDWKRKCSIYQDFVQEGAEWLSVTFLVVLIGLVIIFKTRITGVVNDIFEKIVSQSSSV